jgi:hypothetical protein
LANIERLTSRMAEYNVCLVPHDEIMNNHKAYSTGCPTFTKYAVCKEFYDKCPPDKIKAVVQSYKKYQQDLGKQMLERCNNDHKTIHTLQLEYNSEDMAHIKKVLFTQYKQDFDEEFDREDNPYDNLKDEHPIIDIQE